MQKCHYKNCRKKAVSLSQLCWRHIEDKDAYKESLAKYIRENSSIREFYLRYVKMDGFDLIDVDCREVDFSFSDMEGVNFSGADLKNANLSHVNLKNAYLDNADLSGSCLLSCNLSGARLWHADLRGANLAEANLSEANLLNCNLACVKFWNVNIKGVKLLSKHNFLINKAGIFGKYALDEKGPVSAAEGYRSLKQYFMSMGRYEDASWASFKEKQMQRRKLLQERNIAYLPSLLMGLMCGYGEKPYRVVVFSVAVIFIYAILYYAMAVINIPAPGAHAALSDSLYFSIVTFTTLGFGDMTPKPVPFFQMLVGTEAFFGAFIMGLFVFTLARKYSAR